MQEAALWTQLHLSNLTPAFLPPRSEKRSLVAALKDQARLLGLTGDWSIKEEGEDEGSIVRSFQENYGHVAVEILSAENPAEQLALQAPCKVVRWQTSWGSICYDSLLPASSFTSEAMRQAVVQEMRELRDGGADIGALREYLEHAQLVEHRIVLLGFAREGKSSLFNALLGLKAEEKLSPEASGNQSVTDMVLEVRCSAAATYSAEVEQMSLDQWRDTVHLLAREAEAEEKANRNKKPHLVRREAARRKSQMITTLLGADKPDWEQSPLPAELQPLAAERLELTAVSLSALVELLKPYTYNPKVLNRGPTIYPLVQRIVVSGPFNSLPPGVSLIDVPGVESGGRKDLGRQAKTAAEVAKADTLLVCFKDPDLNVEGEEEFKSRLPWARFRAMWRELNGSEVTSLDPRVLFVGLQYDQLGELTEHLHSFPDWLLEAPEEWRDVDFYPTSATVGHGLAELRQRFERTFFTPQVPDFDQLFSLPAQEPRWAQPAALLETCQELERGFASLAASCDSPLSDLKLIDVSPIPSDGRRLKPRLLAWPRSNANMLLSTVEELLRPTLVRWDSGTGQLLALVQSSSLPGYIKAAALRQVESLKAVTVWQRKLIPELASLVQLFFDTALQQFTRTRQGKKGRVTQAWLLNNLAPYAERGAVLAKAKLLSLARPDGPEWWNSLGMLSKSQAPEAPMASPALTRVESTIPAMRLKYPLVLPLDRMGWSPERPTVRYAGHEVSVRLCASQELAEREERILSDLQSGPAGLVPLVRARFRNVLLLEPAGAFIREEKLGKSIAAIRCLPFLT